MIRSIDKSIKLIIKAFALQFRSKFPKIKGEGINVSSIQKSSYFESIFVLDVVD